MKQITVDTLRQWISDQTSFHLIDVREPFEHDDFNIGGQLIPLEQIVQHAASIPTDQPVVLYCRKGIRSQIAIQRLLQKRDFDNLYNLQGGTEAWKSKLKS